MLNPAAIARSCKVSLALALVCLDWSPRSVAADEATSTAALEQATSLQKRLLLLRAGPTNENTRIVRPRAAANLTAGITQPTARIDVNYSGFSAQAKQSFQAAVDVWASTLSSGVTIKVNAHFQDLGNPQVLGSAGPATFLRDFPNAPKSGVFYPVALANKLAGTDLAASVEDIEANFNSAFPNWYFGDDGRTPPNQYDFMSVVLHELGHGLGFVGSAGVDDMATGSLNSPPMVYDIFVENGQGKTIPSFANPSGQLGQQLAGGNLFFDGTLTKAASIPAGERARLYAPSSWEEGSSYSHLDEDTYPAGDPNSLMTPVLGLSESIHTPGSVAMGILRDMGW